jgi:catechol 2,3-dioxygenase-like lactoylglutathione lyase family enzyme
LLIKIAKVGYILKGRGMNIRFDHLSLSARNPQKMSDFLVALLDLTVGTRPNLEFSGYFLFTGDKDVIHIFANQQPDVSNQLSQNEQPQNIVHHVSFFSDDYQDVLARIAKLGLRYSMSEVPGTSVKQIFVRGPEGLIIEIQALPNG